MSTKRKTKLSSHNTMRVFVLDKYKRPLMPCHPARARKLIRAKRAVIYRRFPFVIILKDRTLEESTLQPIQLRIDPGSKVTGLALVARFNNYAYLIWAAHLTHRAYPIIQALEKRRSIRRNRRNRKTRYRKPKFTKRKSKRDIRGQQSSNKKGWLPPSIRSRIDNVYNYTLKLLRYAPFKFINMEMVNFDTHSMTVGKKLYGTQYQHGTLYGYRIKQFLLEYNNYKCAYCGATNVPLEIEHIIPKSRGGTNHLKNLTIACTDCNRRKGNLTAKEFGYPHITGTTNFMRDMAAVNSSKYALFDKLKSIPEIIEVNALDAGYTKFNRKKSKYRKDHFIDAACVDTRPVIINTRKPTVLEIVATGRGNRHVQLVDAYGFPRRNKDGSVIAPKKHKRMHGFSTGDIVRINLTHHPKHRRFYWSRLNGVRKRPSMVFREDGCNIDVHPKYCTLIQRNDGYDYFFESKKIK